MELAEYRRKRNFHQTTEPRGRSTRKNGKKSRFVVQKHDARRLHYDFRLEVDGILKSWAVPKGPSMNRRDKRLAVATEDHPLDYIGFEGEIPEGQYGAGTVEIWDEGSFRNLMDVPPGQAIDKGHIRFWLDGKRLRGAFALTRTSGDGGKQNWLLLKMDDQKAEAKNAGFSNLDKVLFPEDGITKGDLIDYYRRVSEYMLPYLKDRPITMQRFPNGIGKKGFYHKDAPDYFPDWIRTESVAKEGGTVRHVICNDADTLLYLANQGCITPHVWSSRIDAIDRPDRVIFDLDPPESRHKDLSLAVRMLRELLEELELRCYPMITGSRGVHLVAPIRAEKGFDEVREFARDVATLLASREPERLTVEARKAKRRGRILIDHTRNGYAQTAVPPYAVRARPGAPVATPLSWEEAGKGGASDRYTMKNVFRRLARTKDPWPDISKQSQSLDKAIGILAGITSESP